MLEAKRPYVTPGSLEDFPTHGRKRLLPFLGPHELSSIDERLVRQWLASMVVAVEAGDLAAKT